jgi:hypothetical protein
VNTHLATFREIYPFEFITCKVPRPFTDLCQLKDADIEPYDVQNDLLKAELRFKLVFNFTTFSQLDSHYKKGSFAVLNLKQLVKLAGNAGEDLSTILKKALLN